MKVIYMGTPDFAVPALAALVDAGHQVCCVISQPDAMRDRGKKVKPTPVKIKALELGIPVLQPERIKGNEALLDELKGYAPDAIVVAAYGQLLPKELLNLPEYGCINIHGSLLPKYRGAAPIQKAILDGERETGITIMFMEEGLDTGDMLAKRSTLIEKKNSAGLHDELAVMGAELLIETLPKIEDGSLIPEKQDDTKSSYAPMIKKQDGQIDFAKSPEEIECLIRAFDPWPGAFTIYHGQPLKIWQADVADRINDASPGEITGVSDDGIEISAGGRSIVAKTVQFPGKKRIFVKDYLRGNTIEKNSVLG